MQIPTDTEIMEMVLAKAEARGEIVTKDIREFALKFANTIGKFTKQNNVTWGINKKTK